MGFFPEKDGRIGKMLCIVAETLKGGGAFISISPIVLVSNVFVAFSGAWFSRWWLILNPSALAF